MLESICAPQIIDPIIQVLSCYQDSIGNNTAEILNWYSVFLEKQNEIAYELQNQLNLSGSNYSPEENNQQMHEALINFNKNCNGWKVSIGRMIELCSLATNIIIFSIEKWKTQLRTSANNFEIKDIKGDFLDVPENLSENLIKLEKKTVTLCKSIFTLLDSVKLIKENNDLVNQYPSLILGSFNNQEIVYENHLQKLIILLAKMTLVIYNNPVQVLKDLNLFSASGFWLAGLGIRIDGNHIIRFQASIIPENEGYAQLNRSKSDLKHKIKTVRIKENQNGTLDLDSTLKSNGSCIVQLCKMRYENLGKYSANNKEDGENIKAKSPPPKKELIADQISYFVLESQPIQIEGETIVLKALSLPIVLIVNTSQESQALSTILWKNAFGNASVVGLDALIAEISSIFKSRTTNSNSNENQEGRGLSQFQIKHLKQKVFNIKLNQKETFPNFVATMAASQINETTISKQSANEQTEKNETRISFDEFAREKITSRNKNCAELSLVQPKEYTIWEYFYQALKLLETEENRIMWCRGYIFGFISKEYAKETLLQKARPGTVLVRFSESRPGAISCSGYSKSAASAGYKSSMSSEPTSPQSMDTSDAACQPQGNQAVVLLEPWDREDLKKMSLIKRILSKNILLPYIFCARDEAATLEKTKLSLETIEEEVARPNAKQGMASKMYSTQLAAAGNIPEVNEYTFYRPSKLIPEGFESDLCLQFRKSLEIKIQSQNSSIEKPFALSARNKSISQSDGILMSPASPESVTTEKNHVPNYVIPMQNESDSITTDQIIAARETSIQPSNLTAQTEKEVPDEIAIFAIENRKEQESDKNPSMILQEIKELETPSNSDPHSTQNLGEKPVGWSGFRFWARIYENGNNHYFA